MRAVRPVEVLIELQEVLRAAERNAVAWSGRQVAGEAEELAEGLQHTLIGEIQRRYERLLTERLVAISQAIEDHFGLRNDGRREGMGDVAQVILVAGRLGGVESLVGAEADRAVRGCALLVDAA